MVRWGEPGLLASPALFPLHSPASCCLLLQGFVFDSKSLLGLSSSKDSPSSFGDTSMSDGFQSKWDQGGGWARILGLMKACCLHTPSQS